MQPLEVVEGDRRIGIYPADEFHVRCYVDFPHPLVGQQEVEMAVNPDTFRHLLARARTFCFERDIEPLRSMGLIRGGSLENAIVLTNDGVMNGPLRFPDEFGRHKALDLIGDLALAGLPLLARVEAHKAGHALHTQLVSRLLADPSLWTIATDEAPIPACETDLVQSWPRLPPPIEPFDSRSTNHYFAKPCLLPQNELTPWPPKDLAIVILAAGKGTRLKSSLAKVLHRAGGRALVEQVLRACAPLGAKKTVVVVGHQAEQVMAVVEPSGRDHRPATAATRYRARHAGSPASVGWCKGRRGAAG